MVLDKFKGTNQNGNWGNLLVTEGVYMSALHLRLVLQNCGRDGFDS